MSISITHLMDHESTSSSLTLMPTVADSTYHPGNKNLTSNIDALLIEVD